MKRKTQNYLCVDVLTEMIERNMIAGEKRLVEATLDIVDNEGNPYPDPEGHFTLREVIQKARVEHPELHWHLLDRTKHGKASMNTRHIKVEFYIHHDEYKNGRELADMLASEIETLGENLCDCPLPPAVTGKISNNSDR